MIGWFFVDVFDGAVFPDDAVEHWVEAGFWAVAALGHVAVARRRPPADEHRLAAWLIAGGMAVFGVAMGMRATLPDATAFRWAVVTIAAYSVVVWLSARRLRTAGAPAGEPPAS